jgi:hypothetical protein
VINPFKKRGTPIVAVSPDGVLRSLRAALVFKRRCIAYGKRFQKKTHRDAVGFFSGQDHTLNWRERAFTPRAS